MGPIVGVSKPIKKWYRGLIVRQSCHNRLASDFLARDTHLSTLSVVLTALTSSAIFVSLTPLASATGDELAMELEASTSTTTISSSISTAGVSAWSQILAVLAGTIAACNTVLQGITRTLYYGQRGERHLRAYREYSVLRFQLENIVGDKPRYAEHKVDRTRLEAWIRSYEEVLEESPVRTYVRTLERCNKIMHMEMERGREINEMEQSGVEWSGMGCLVLSRLAQRFLSFRSSNRRCRRDPCLVV